MVSDVHKSMLTHILLLDVVDSITAYFATLTIFFSKIKEIFTQLDELQKIGQNQWCMKSVKIQVLV